MTISCMQCYYKDDCPASMRPITKPESMLGQIKDEQLKKIAEDVIKSHPRMFENTEDKILEKLLKHMPDAPRNAKVDDIRDSYELKKKAIVVTVKIFELESGVDKRFRYRLTNSKLGNIVSRNIIHSRLSKSKNTFSEGAKNMLRNLNIEEGKDDFTVKDFHEKVCKAGMRKYKQKRGDDDG